MRGAKQLEQRISGSQSNASGKNKPKKPANSKVRFLFEVSSQPLSGSRMSYLSNQPILILKEGSSSNRGKDAQRGNISAARIVSEVVKTTLGPRGMDKMMVDSLGDVTITSDGATVLDELDVQHPAAKMLVEVAKTQDDEVGDGTTTSVVLAGELLKRAEFLLDQGVHPTVINAGYKKAGERAKEILNEISKPVDLKDTETLRKVAITAMRGKSLGSATEHFAKIAVQAVNQIIEKRGESFVADIDNIQLVKKEGKSLMDTELVNGVIIDKEVVHPGMPKRMQKAKIALLDTAMEIEKTDFSEEIKISNPQQMQSFLGEDTKSGSILVRAGLWRMVDEDERSLKDALSVVIDVVKKNKIVAGGGAVETELAKRIRDYATKIGGREQLAVEAFADAMEAIPRTLSENAGLDQVDILVALRAAHETKGLWSGVNVYT